MAQIDLVLSGIALAFTWKMIFALILGLFIASFSEFYRELVVLLGWFFFTHNLWVAPCRRLDHDGGHFF